MNDMRPSIAENVASWLPGGRGDRERRRVWVVLGAEGRVAMLVTWRCQQVLTNSHPVGFEP